MPVRDTLKLIERIVENDVCAFNLTFDWWQTQHFYCTGRLLDPARPPRKDAWLAKQKEAVWGPCLRPKAALDLMLIAMAGPAQSLMERDDIRIKRVPAAIAPWLAERLRELVQLPDIYFTYRKEGYQWTVDDHEGDAKDFPDVKLVWGAARGLKPLGKHLLGVEVMDLPVPDQEMPKDKDVQWNPFNNLWVPHLEYHQAHWRLDQTARKYAHDDVEVLLYGLWKHFGCPKAGDLNSELACLVASCRWRGYNVSIDLVRGIRECAERTMESAPRAPATVMSGLKRLAGPAAALAIKDTKAETLHAIGGELVGGEFHGGWGDDLPVVAYARRVIQARSAEKERDICRKLEMVMRFHPDFKVTGALSDRMAGAGGLNAQGINGKQKGSRLREAFVLADSGETLEAGDFDAFEVAIAAAAYDDTNLTADLKSGKKIHAIYGAVMYQLDYDKVKKDARMYNDAKRAFLGGLYGAQTPKKAKVLGLSEEQVDERERDLVGRYPGIGRARARVAARFCSMRQVGGIGSRIEWEEPADYAESLLGTRRYFTLENDIERALFAMAQKPEGMPRPDGRVMRRAGRLQTPAGATQSAIYACAFGMQASAMRQAANHEIQATGARITKELQYEIWERQPRGIHPFVVRPMQIHDEIQCPISGGDVTDVTACVSSILERHRPRIPLIDMKWLHNLNSWAEKG